MAKILGKTHSPYVPDADTHSLTLKGTKRRQSGQIDQIFKLEIALEIQQPKPTEV